MARKPRKYPGAKPGRPKGSVNKITLETREVFKRLIEKNADKMESWLTRTARSDPGKALQLIAGMAEFCVPKLNRTEVTQTPETAAQAAQAAAELAASKDPAQAASIYRQMVFGKPLGEVAPVIKPVGPVH